MRFLSAAVLSLALLVAPAAFASSASAAQARAMGWCAVC